MDEEPGDPSRRAQLCGRLLLATVGLALTAATLVPMRLDFPGPHRRCGSVVAEGITADTIDSCLDVRPKYIRAIALATIPLAGLAVAALFTGRRLQAVVIALWLATAAAGLGMLVWVVEYPPDVVFITVL